MILFRFLTNLILLFTGALLGSDVKDKIKVKDLEVVIASARCSTKFSAKPKVLKLETGSISLENFDNTNDSLSKVVLCSAGNPSGDMFVYLEKSDGGFASEAGQSKFYTKSTLKKKDAEEESEKAMDNATDFFVLYTTIKGSGKDLLVRERMAVITADNFRDYFGPLAGRAFCSLFHDINNASRSKLKALQGIGEVKAANLLVERPFASFDDAKKRSGLSEKLLKKHFYLVDKSLL